MHLAVASRIVTEGLVAERHYEIERVHLEAHRSLVLGGGLELRQKHLESDAGPERERRALLLVEDERQLPRHAVIYSRCWALGRTA